MNVLTKKKRHFRVRRLYHAKSKNINQRSIWLSNQSKKLFKFCRLIYLKMKAKLIVNDFVIKFFIEIYKRSSKFIVDIHDSSLSHAQRHFIKYMIIFHILLHFKKILSKFTFYRQSSTILFEIHRFLSNVYRCSINFLKIKINRFMTWYAWYSIYRCRKQKQWFTFFEI